MIYLEKVSENDYTQSITGKAYKVFRVKNGKLYPPMVANAGGSDTPIGVWLDAEEGEFIELDGIQRVIPIGVRKDRLLQRIANLDNLTPEERKEEARKIKDRTLAYRPGWHLGDIPRAKQFDSTMNWQVVEDFNGVPDKEVGTMKSFIDGFVKKANVGKVAYVKELGEYFVVLGGQKTDAWFPYDFVWAECDYVADIDYQDEAMSYGYRGGPRFKHSLAGLPRVPQGGAYRYRTNPRPDTVPWVITGAMKVTRLLSDDEVADICLAHGVEPIERQGGDVTLEELGL